MKVHLPDEAATVTLARRLASALPAEAAGWTLLLEGELGAGKSTLARAMILAMGHRGPVPSPTYTLVEPYDLPRAMVYHVDLYRISNEEELRYLGWTDLEDGVRLVEWPDRAPSLAQAADLRVCLSYAAAGRDAEITALSPRGAEFLRQVEKQPFS